MHADFERRSQLAFLYHYAAHEALCRFERKISTMGLTGTYQPAIGRIEDWERRHANRIYNLQPIYRDLGVQLKAASSEVIRKYIALEETILADLKKGGADAERLVADYNVMHYRHTSPTYASRAGIDAARRNGRVGLQAFGDGYLQAMETHIGNMEGGPAATSALRVTRDLTRILLDTIREHGLR